jgi:hypothetical protein
MDLNLINELRGKIVHMGDNPDGKWGKTIIRLV